MLTAFLFLQLVLQVAGQQPPADRSHCVDIDEEVVDHDLFGCRSDTLMWRFDCTKSLALPTESTKVLEFTSLHASFNRCPHPSLKVELNFVVDLPDFITSNLPDGVTAPEGPQTVRLDKAINGTDLELLAWPIVGVLTIGPNAIFDEPRRLGAALVIKRPTVVRSTMVNFDVAFRICALQVQCTEFSLATNVTFGFDDVCCIPRSLLCDAEVPKCYPTTTTVAPTGAFFPPPGPNGAPINQMDGKDVAKSHASTLAAVGVPLLAAVALL
jgi:hypothetical protein